jgi:hypothetical protein
MAASGLSGKYDLPMDRESAFEILGKRAEEAARAAAEAEEREARTKADERDAREQARDRRYDDGQAGRSTSRRSSGRSDSIAETFGKSLARQLGTKTGQALVRGVLGSLFRAR